MTAPRKRTGIETWRERRDGARVFRRSAKRFREDLAARIQRASMSDFERGMLDRIEAADLEETDHRMAEAGRGL